MDQRQRMAAAFVFARKKDTTGGSIGTLFKPANPPNARDVVLNAYVPSGMSEKEWAAKQAEAKKQKDTTNKFWSKKRAQGYEDLTDW